MDILNFKQLVGNKSKKSSEIMSTDETISQSDKMSRKLTKKSSQEDLKQQGFQIGRILGEGSYSSVRAATFKGKEIAVKIMSHDKISSDFSKKFLPREIEVLSKVKHKNIIHVYKIFNYPHKVYIFTEYLQRGDLLGYVKGKGRLNDGEARHFFKQMVSALQYLHGLHIAHRDLKCENVMLAEDDTIRLIDFGFCRSTVTSSGKRLLSMTYCGSTAYAAPEVLQGTPYNPMMYDVWSLGCVLFIMVSGTMPFDDFNVRKMVQTQLKRKLKFPAAVVIQPELKNLIKIMLEPDVTRRISMERVSCNSWVKSKDGQSKDDQSKDDQSKYSKRRSSTVGVQTSLNDKSST